MSREPIRRPTDAELAILGVLWERGPSTVREVHDRLRAERETGYTTVLKTMQIMTEKGLVSRDASRRSHVYRAVLDRSATEGRLIDDLRDRAFGGSTSRLVLRALSERAATPEELAQVEALLRRLDGPGPDEREGVP